MKKIELTRNYDPSKPKVRALLDEIIELLRKGYSRAKCVKYLVENHDQCRQTASKYVNDAYVDIYEAGSYVNIKLLKSQYIDRIESMLEKAIETSKFDQAARLQEMLNKINGLYIEKQEVKVDSDTIKFKFDS